MAPTVTPIGPPPAAASGSDDGGGGILDGLGKGLSDVWHEGTGLVTGAVHHVNVFDPDQLADTWSNDFQIGKTIVTHPLASGEAIVSGVWAPIKSSYEDGGVDEAAARAVPSLLATVVGGKGVTKLSKLRGVQDAARAADHAPSPADPPRIMPGGTAPDGSFIQPVVEGDSTPLSARPHAGQHIQRVYGQPADELGLIPTDEYSAPGGHSWTPERIEDMNDPRARLGLPEENAGRFKIDGVLVDPKDVIVRHVLPLDGRPGGGLEYLTPDPAGQIRIIHVEGVTPHL